MIVPSLRRALTGVTLTLLAVAVALLAGSTAAQAQGDPPLSLSILTNNENIPAGDIARFSVMLENTGDSNLPNIQLSLTLDGQVEQVRLLPDEQETSGVKVDGVRRRDGQIIWRGGLAAGGKLVFDVAAQTSLIDQQITLAGEAGPVDAEPTIKSSATVTAKAYDLNPNDLSFEKVLLWDDGTGLTEGENAEVMPRQTVGIELRLTNNSAATVYTLLVDQMNQGVTAAAAGDVSCELEPVSASIAKGRGFSVPVSALGDAFAGDDTFTYAFLVRTPPGETTTTRVRARVVGETECTIEGQAQAYSTADGPAEAQFVAAEVAAENDNVTARLEFVQSLLVQQPQLSAIVAFLILLSDFGDAPDSSNHFNAPDENIPAYPGIDGRFPTVFDPATGSPQGPKHKNGLPVHLGQRVSGEFVADLGLWRNLNPPGELADLDLHDDGVDPSAVTFQHCLAPLIPFEVTFNQRAVDHYNNTGEPVYLNIWLDGNHDGDWEDSVDCDGITAIEHIVIDQELVPSFAGTFTLMAPTSNLPIPVGGEGETMWMRVMISDQPSEKTGTIQNLPALPQEYGDGRGPANGYRWGETEDYLYVPQAVVAGPGGFGADLEVIADATIQGAFAGGFDETQVTAAAIDGWEEGVAALKLRIRNRGDRMAPKTELKIEMEPYLGVPDILTLESSWCLTCTVAAASAQPIAAAETEARSLDLPVDEKCDQDGCYLIITMENIAPGAGVGMVMHYPHCAGASCTGADGSEVEFKVSLNADGDSNPANNSAVKRALRLAREPIIFSPVAGSWTGCLTCTVAFKGFGEPGTVVSLFSDAFGENKYSTEIDERGFWQIDAQMPDGIHQVEMGWTGCLTCTVQTGAVTAADLSADPYVYGEELSLTVDRSLLWNPNSFGYTRTSAADLQSAAVAEADDSCGPWSIIDDAGRMDLNNWRIPVWSGKEIELGLDLFCESGGSASLRYANQEVSFSDEDGDGSYKAVFTPQIGSSGLDGVDVELALSCGAQSESYTGKMVPVTPVQVTDRETGRPLPGMTVELFRANTGAGGSEGDGEGQFSSWEAHAYGQTNPQTTDADGYFSFIVPRGRYGLVISGPGYQTLRYGPFRAQGPITGFNIGMPPTVTASGQSAVVQITDDGYLPAMLEIAPGTNVEWQNLALDAAGTQREGGSLQSAAAHAESWDSGLLFTGESHVVRFDETGTFTYSDPADPSKTAIVKVTEPAVVPPEEIEEKVYLPYVLYR